MGENKKGDNLNNVCVCEREREGREEGGGKGRGYKRGKESRKKERVYIK